MNSYTQQFQTADKQFSNNIMRITRANHIALMLYDRSTPQHPITFLFNDGIPATLAANYSKRICLHDPLLPHAGTSDTDNIRRTDIGLTNTKRQQLESTLNSDALYQDVLSHAGYRETAAYTHGISKNLHLVVGLLLSKGARNRTQLQLDAASQLVENWLEVCADTLIESSIRQRLHNEPQHAIIDATTICRGDYGLSQREADVVNELVRGKSNKKISATLSLSEYTIENYLRNIYKKFSVHSRTELIATLAQLPK